MQEILLNSWPMVSQWKTLKQGVLFFLFHDISDDFMTVLQNGLLLERFTLGIFILLSQGL